MTDMAQDLNTENINPLTPADLSNRPDMPQTLPIVVSGAAAFRLTLTLDAVLCILFLAFGAALRLINLSGIVLNDAEAHEALRLSARSRLRPQVRC